MLKAPSRALASDEMFHTVKMAKTPEPAIARKFSVLFWTVVNAEVMLFIKDSDVQKGAVTEDCDVIPELVLAVQLTTTEQTSVRTGTSKARRGDFLSNARQRSTAPCTVLFFTEITIPLNGQVGADL